MSPIRTHHFKTATTISHTTRQAYQARRTPRRGTAPLSTTCQRRAMSPLFQLGALSNSRESQWFSKATGISAIEFSPQLQLIRSGEVVPMKIGNDETKAETQAEKRRGEELLEVGKSTAEDDLDHAYSDAKALAVGRQVLQSHRKSTAQLEQRLEAQGQLLAKTRSEHLREKEAWAAERRKMEKDNRAASLGILAAVGVATFVATWTYMPSERTRWTTPKSFRGRTPSTSSKTAPRKPADTAVSSPAVEVSEHFVPSAGVSASSQKMPVSQPAPRAAESGRAFVSQSPSGEGERSFWRGLFWSG